MNQKKIDSFTKELTELLTELGYDLDMQVYDTTDTQIRYLIKLLTPSQYGRMFKIPNLIYDHLDVEASEITDVSGTYEEWLLAVPY